MSDQENDWRAHWRLIFDVIQGVPRMQQEISIWSTDPGWPATRLAYEIKELQTVRERNVQYGPSWVEFTDGFMEYETNILADIQNLLNSIGIVLEELTVPVGDENIYIRADVSLAGGLPGPYNPIFYYPQDIYHSVQLTELVDQSYGTRGIEWIISGQFYRLEEKFRLEPNEEHEPRHGLRVRQDVDEGVDHFDFFVDSIPIGKGLTQASHLFESGPQRFFLGHAPNYGLNLTGRIYHVTFDPNNSCGRCPEPTWVDPAHD